MRISSLPVPQPRRLARARHLSAIRVEALSDRVARGIDAHLFDDLGAEGEDIARGAVMESLAWGSDGPRWLVWGVDVLGCATVAAT
jgi:hypothetical protein